MRTERIQRAYDTIALWESEPDSIAKRNALLWAIPIIEKYEQKQTTIKRNPTDYKKLYEQEKAIREDYEHLYEEALVLLANAGLDPEEPVRQSTLRMYRRKVQEMEIIINTLTGSSRG